MTSSGGRSTGFGGGGRPLSGEPREKALLAHPMPTLAAAHPMPTPAATAPAPADLHLPMAPPMPPPMPPMAPPMPPTAPPMALPTLPTTPPTAPVAGSCSTVGSASIPEAAGSAGSIAGSSRRLLLLLTGGSTLGGAIDGAVMGATPRGVMVVPASVRSRADVILGGGFACVAASDLDQGDVVGDVPAAGAGLPSCILPSTSCTFEPTLECRGVPIVRGETPIDELAPLVR